MVYAWFIRLISPMRFASASPLEATRCKQRVRSRRGLPPEPMGRPSGVVKRLLHRGLSLSLLLGSLAEPARAADWKALPSIPDPEGFAAPFAGVHDGRLIVAGGANFPNAKPWQGGTKVWYDRVFVLDQPDGVWREAGRLPRPLAYGVSISTDDGICCIGGSDATRHYPDVFHLSLKSGTATTQPLPPLPKPCANLSGALVGRSIYVAGGVETADAVRALHTVWSLDLDHLDRGWQSIEPWPGRERMLAAAGAHDGSFFLVGGTALKAGPDGKPEREWLRDGFSFTPGKGWRRLADVPRVSVAAPSPMPRVADGRLLLIGGDDGTQVAAAPDQHRGFPTEVLAYDAVSDTWNRAGAIPVGLVTTPAVIWRNHVVVPGGEKKPGIRSTEVWAFPLK
jgi:N-acetylneuraminate epimerase